MTSQLNHTDTVSFFRKHSFFGAHEQNVMFFKQGVMPALNHKGKIMMSSPHEMILYPNGSGGLFEQISKNYDIKSVIKGSKYVQVIGVENVLNRVLDPFQIGYMHDSQLQASMKCC